MNKDLDKIAAQFDTAKGASKTKISLVNADVKPTQTKEEKIAEVQGGKKQTRPTLEATEHKNCKISVYLTEDQAKLFKKIATKMTEDSLSPLKLSDFARGVLLDYMKKNKHLLNKEV